MEILRSNDAIKDAIGESIPDDWIICDEYALPSDAVRMIRSCIGSIQCTSLNDLRTMLGHLQDHGCMSITDADCWKAVAAKDGLA